MTLARKITIGSAAMVVGLLLLGAASLWGLRGINRNLGQAIEEYDTLRRVYEFGLDASRAREMVDAAQPDPRGAADRVRAAILRLDELPPGRDSKSVQRARDALRDTLDQLSKADSSANAPEGQAAALSAETRAAAIASLNRVLNNMGNLSAQTRRVIAAIEAERENRLAAAMLAMAVLSALFVLAAIVIGVLQYRAVSRPLARLAAGVREIAAGRFSQRLSDGGDDELAALSADFNRMAVELDTLYRELEAKVDAKSSELIRSERLASVGFLAAGVAHEINNPLGIIAGHAELTLRAMQRAAKQGDGDASKKSAVEAEQTLRVIADEAFRCKQITEKLLALLRGGAADNRAAVDAGAAAREVVALTAGLPRYRGREVVVDTPPGEDVRVTANDVELKQVLLNLVVNALEATDAGGRVSVAARRRGAVVEIVVADNGRGMTRETLDRVFEPFFTQRRPDETEASPPSIGTGLGLSITHAIVESHRGRIRAESDGPGNGSRFIMEWPGTDEGRDASKTPGPKPRFEE